MDPMEDDSVVLLGPEWPTDQSMPSTRANLSSMQLDDNVAIYDDVGQVLVMLNPSASAVLDSCDGNTTFETIVSSLAERHGADVGSVREDVWHTMRKLVTIGLLVLPH
jgi:hypothetical protein